MVMDLKISVRCTPDGTDPVDLRKKLEGYMEYQGPEKNIFWDVREDGLTGAQFWVSDDSPEETVRGLWKICGENGATLEASWVEIQEGSIYKEELVQGTPVHFDFDELLKLPVGRLHELATQAVVLDEVLDGIVPGGAFYDKDDQCVVSRTYCESAYNDEPLHIEATGTAAIIQAALQLRDTINKNKK